VNARTALHQVGQVGQVGKVGQVGQVGKVGIVGKVGMTAVLAMAVCWPIAATGAPGGASAPPEDPKAKTQAQALLREGTAAYGHGDYATALDRFTAAFRIYPSPKLWFNIGQANRDLGRPVEAVAAFDRFLREAEGAPPETIAEARRSAAELKTKLGQIRINTNDGAEITVDGKQVGSAPLGEMVWTTPGRHQVAVQQEGFAPAIEDVMVTTGQVTALEIQLSPIDLRPAGSGADAALVGAGDAGAEPTPVYRRPWFWIAVGAVVAAGAVTAIVLASGDAASSSGVPQTTLGAQRAF
jgi:hypothetical protein